MAEHRGLDKLDDLRRGLEEIRKQYPSSRVTPGLAGLIEDVEQRIANARFCSPNPFKPGADNNVTFDSSARRITIYNYEAKMVKKLSGNEWDGTDEDGQTVTPGIYFYHAEVDGNTRVGKLAVIY